MSAQKAPVDEQVFIALQAYEQLKRDALRANSISSDGPAKFQRLSFNDIVNCVKAPSTSTAKDALILINKSIDYRRKYRFVLMQISMLQSPKQIAASTEPALLKRANEQFTLQVSLHKNAIEQNEATVNMRMLQTDLESTGIGVAFLHCETEQRIEVLELHATGQGDFATTLDAQESRISALTHVNSHIYVTF
ncbi:hypothetical protein [Glaciecola sp. SC05]|uniref:hypothetical protein n=1 Tax=Glaciecola sp. SC05 TaxID=1987355 RepID=UPI003527B33B